MIRTTVGMVVSGLAAGGLFAEGTTSDPVAPYANITALGIVAVVLIYTVTKILPNLHQRFIDQSTIFSATIEKMQTTHTDTVKSLTAGYSGTLDKMHERMSGWMEHTRDMTAKCAEHQAMHTVERSHAAGGGQ